MAKRTNRYRQMEQMMTYLLIGDGAVFLIFLLASGFGIGWLKVLTAIIAIGVAGLCLVFLYISQELLRPRSRWMSIGFAAVVLCLVVSLICNYPSPNPYKDKASSPAGDSQTTTHYSIAEQL